MSKKIYETDAQTMADLTAGKETVWKNPLRPLRPGARPV